MAERDLAVAVTGPTGTFGFGLAFLVTGTAPGEVTRSVNVDGTLNAYRAAAAAGARRFVYASSVAAYGFHPDNPIGMTEEWPVRPAARLFYARQKAELESLLQAEAARVGGPDLYLLRPPIVLARTPWAPRTCCPGRSRRSAAAWPPGPAGSRCRSRYRSCRCSSSTRRTWARRSCAAS